MVLGKSNKLNPKNLAQKLKKFFLIKLIAFSDIEIAGPGFINIKLSKCRINKKHKFDFK